MENINLSRVLIDDDNPSITCNDDLCKKCKLCQKTCHNDMGVFGFYDSEKTNGHAICINCGQCIQACPFNAIRAVSDIDRVEEAISNPEKIVVFNTAPAVRVAIGDAFGFEKGAFLEGKLVSAIKALGANYVLDVSCGADLTIMEEASELIRRIENKSSNFPMFTSCCPAWVKMAEIFYPELLNNLSSAKSPIAMQGTIVKTYFANKLGLDPDNIVNVTVAPCVAKKAEAKRKELNASGANHPDVDIVITTVELQELIKKSNIDFNSLNDEKFDSIFGEGSSSGLIFGNTGGVLEACLRTAYYLINGHNMDDSKLNEVSKIRGIDNVKIMEADLGKYKLNVAAVSKMSEVKKLLEEIKNGELKLDFVEVMACDGGCANGGGQPKFKRPEAQITRQNRNLGLYSNDAKANIRYCHENPNIIRLYDEFLGKPLSEKSHELLHTHFTDKSCELGSEK